MVGFSEKVSDKLAGEGIGVDLLDLRTTSPLDDEAILDSVEATGRLVIVDESPPRCSLATDIASIVAAKAFTSLNAPPAMVNGPHPPLHFPRQLQSPRVPSPPKTENRKPDGQ